MTTKQAWVGFWILALIWGSSYLFIRIGVEQLPPLQLVFARTGIAAIGLNLVIYAQGKRLPLDRYSLQNVLLLGVLNIVIPFALITWGEQFIESGLASVLQGTTALFSLVIAHFAFADERISWRKVVGLLVGFLGVLVLASRSSGAEVTTANAALHLLGQLAIVGSSLCYATGNSYSRKMMQNRLEPLIVAAGTMTVAAVITGALTYLAPLWGGAAPVPWAVLSSRVLSAVLVLGLLNTFGAYLIFYSLIATLGAARASMVTYVIPVVGLVLGAIFLAERVDLRLLFGAILILGSIGIVNIKLATLLKRSTSASAAD
jgi:drug/metabolite transporter (DMT)-like permease